jgi:hypothetical protein
VKPAAMCSRSRSRCSSPASHHRALRRRPDGGNHKPARIEQGPDRRRRRRDYAREAVMIGGIIFGDMMLVATGFAIYAVRA